jgi:hypothetical protein
MLVQALELAVKHDERDYMRYVALGGNFASQSVLERAIPYIISMLLKHWYYAVELLIIKIF